jgi:putative ABC transport system permease protein
MRRLSGLAWRSLRARPLRTILTGIGVALGVGVVSAALTMNAAVDASVNRTVASMLGSAQLRVGAFNETGLSPESQQTIASTPDVLVAAPELERKAYLAARPGSPAGTVTPPATVVGIDPVLDPQIHPLTPSQGTTIAAGSRSALVSQTLAASDGYAVGSPITILGPNGSDNAPFTVSGIVPDGALAPADANRTVLIPLTAAQSIFGTEGVTRVDLLLAPAANVDTESGLLESRLRTQPYTISAAGDVAAALGATTADVQATAALIAAISLFVGAFLIFNTLSMTVAERVRDVALLRAAGATRDQVHALILLQAAVIGLAGSAAGVFLGTLLSRWLIVGLTATTPASIGVGPVSVAVDPVGPSVGGIVLAIVVGLVVTLAAAIEPAWRAGRISPVEALQERPELGRTLSARLRWLLVVFAVVGVVGLALWPSNASGGMSASLAVYGVLLAVTLISPAILPALGRIAGAPFALVVRAEERLGRGALTRERSRTALTVGSLTIGLAMIIAIAAVGQNDRSTAGSWLTNVIPGDELMTSLAPVPLADGIQESLAGLGGVERVTPVGRFDLAYKGTRVDAAAMSLTNLLADGRLSFLGAAPSPTSFDQGGSVIVPQSQADRLGVHVGDQMAFGAADGTAKRLTVAGIVAHGLPGRTGEALLVAWPDATAQFGVVGADAFAVRYIPGQEDRGRTLAEGLARQLSLDPAPLASIQGAAGNALDHVFGLFDALAAIAVIVAGLGIVNTLTMSVVERVREIGVLRAVGMTRRQVWRMVVVEAGMIGVMGAILGAITGVAVGVVLLAVAGGPSAVATYQVPWLVLGGAALFGVVVAMLAAAYPARVASRLPIVRAVQYQ